MTDQLDYILPGGQQIQFTPYRIGGRNGAAATVIGSGSLESENFVAGSAGWRILGDGSVEFSSGTFRGSLDAASGTFSGDLDAAGGTFAGDISAASGTFTGSLEGGEIHIGGFDNTSFHVDADGDMWMGAATAGAAPFSVSRFGGITATDIFLYDPYITTPIVSQGTFDGIDVDGSATIITGGQLASDNYIAGSAGWAIDGDGDAEFNNIIARGILETGPDGSSVEEVLVVPVGGGTNYQGTSWLGPDPIGTGVQSRINQYTDAATTGPFWASYMEIRSDILTIEARNSFDISGIIESDSQIRASYGTAAAPSFAFNGDTNTGMYRQSADYIGFATNGTLIAGIRNDALVTNTAGIAYVGTAGTGAANKIGFKWSSPTIYGSIDNVVTSVVVGTASDIRIKKDIEDFEPGEAIARLRKLRPVNFTPIPLGEDEGEMVRRPGLIAQEVEQHERWAVPPTDDEEQLKSVDYTGLVAPLIAAVQEQQARIEVLEARLSL